MPGLGIGRRGRATASDQDRQVRTLTRRTDGATGARASTRERGRFRFGNHDLASFQKSFASRGWKHGAGFETGEAIAISRKVTAELSRRKILASTRPEPLQVTENTGKIVRP